jgi:hypothetical protein
MTEFILLTGADHDCRQIQEFINDYLPVAFTTVLTDPAVSTWKDDVHVSSVTEPRNRAYSYADRSDVNIM